MNEETNTVRVENSVIEKIVSIIDKYNEVTIICHDQPDPDCLASAFAVQSIAQSMGKNSVIYYGGEIPYTQNSVMMNVLNITAIKLDNEDEDDEESIAKRKYK